MSSVASTFSPDVVDGFMNFAAEVFDAHFIANLDVRRQIARNMLASNEFVEFTQSKFDFEETLNNGGIASRFDAVTEVQRATVSISGGLTHGRKAVIVRNNPDYNIIFKDSVAQPHNLAYAQRIVDTARLKARLTYRAGRALDIGGNYATHIMTHDSRFHCCTLLDDAEEHHRQTQRDAQLELGDYRGADFCVQGTEECDVAAQEGMCVHTLPRIDPKKLPHIFRQHGLQYLVGVHHFDPRMDTDDVGYIADAEMHWKIHDKNGEKIVEHFFSEDSSYPYFHRLDWLLEYSKRNYFTEEHWDYVIYYSVDRIAAGNVYWTMVKMEKATLGAQEFSPQYRYIESEIDRVAVEYPVFEPALGRSINDPRAYEMRTVMIPADLFAYVYKAGIANDTSRPDLPLSFDAMLDIAQTYNFTRRINGTVITTPVKIPTTVLTEATRGIYLLVVQRAAQFRVVRSSYTDVFLRMQKRWGDENTAWLMTKCFSKLAVMPFMAMAKKVEDAVDLMAIHMRTTIMAKRVLGSVKEELPYYVLSPVRSVAGQQLTDYRREEFDLLSDADISTKDVDIQTFCEIFGEHLTEHHIEALRAQISGAKQKTEEKLQEDVNTLLPEVEQNRDSWNNALDVFYENVPLVVRPIQESSNDEVREYFSEKMYEAGLYNYDVGMHVVANAEARVSDTWTGSEPRFSVVHSKNVAINLGIKYISVNEGVPADEGALTDYSVAMDPVSLRLLEIDNGKLCAPDFDGHWLFVYDAFKVFNNFRMGKNLITLARRTTTAPRFEMVLIDGVPGCGKTHEIVEKATADDLVMCAVKETAKATGERLEKSERKIPASRSRTGHSYLCNYVPRARTLYVDEGMMNLPGEINYVVMKSRAKRVEVYGDSAQIGFIDRGSKLGVLRFPKITHWDKIEYRNESRRVPLDICYAMRQFYPEWRRPMIKSFSNVRRSVEIRHIPDVDDVAYKTAEPGVKVLTFLQADKSVAIAGGHNFVDAKDPASKLPTKSAVSSVHEAQGGDYSHVTIMRLNPFTEGVFESVHHLLVSLSRHTHTLKMFSVVPEHEDTLAKILRIAMNATEEDLDDCMLSTPDWLREKFAKVPARGHVASEDSQTAASSEE